MRTTSKRERSKDQREVPDRGKRSGYRDRDRDSYNYAMEVFGDVFANVVHVESDLWSSFRLFTSVRLFSGRSRRFLEKN